MTPTIDTVRQMLEALEQLQNSLRHDASLFTQDIYENYYNRLGMSEDMKEYARIAENSVIAGRALLEQMEQPKPTIPVIEAMRQAVEALELAHGSKTVEDIVLDLNHEITLLQATIGQMERAEPVAYITDRGIVWRDARFAISAPIGTKLFDRPAQDAADAARYRWLRVPRNFIHASVVVDDIAETADCTFNHGAALDSAIDAAMKKENSNET